MDEAPFQELGRVAERKDKFKFRVTLQLMFLIKTSIQQMSALWIVNSVLFTQILKTNEDIHAHLNKLKKQKKSDAGATQILIQGG